jgi:hypothetical protein
LIARLRPEFVTTMPERLEPGLLYVSMEYATAIHLCACGCGSQVVTPLSPTDWELTFDGVDVTLSPSVGNWSFPCRSHYLVRSGRIVPADTWDDDEIAASRRRDARRKAAVHRDLGTTGHQSDVATAPVRPSATRRWSRWLLRR